MPFHRSMLLALLVASTALCRSLVKLDHSAGTMLPGRSVPALEDGHHGLSEKDQPTNQRGSVWDGGPDDGNAPETLPDSRSEDPEKKRSGKGKHSGHGEQPKENTKAIAEQQKKVESLGQKLSEANAKLEALERGDSNHYDGEGHKGHGHKGRKHAEPGTNGPNTLEGGDQKHHDGEGHKGHGRKGRKHSEPGSNGPNTPEGGDNNLYDGEGHKGHGHKGPKHSEPGSASNGPDTPEAGDNNQYDSEGHKGHGRKGRKHSELGPIANGTVTDSPASPHAIVPGLAGPHPPSKAPPVRRARTSPDPTPDRFGSVPTTGDFAESVARRG